MITKRLHLTFALVACCGAGSLWAAAPLTLEKRVEVQEAIERVYYAHRIWPKENPQPKPDFQEAITRAEIAAKVEHFLMMDAALEGFWKEPVTAQALQAELDRMARQTRDPALLSELFHALGDDPALLAECLARPLFVERRCTTWYASDRSVHRQAEARARRALDAAPGPLLAESPDESVTCTTYVAGEAGEPVRDGDGLRQEISPERFGNLREELGSEGATTLKEEDAFFEVRRLLKLTPDTLIVEVLRIPKTPFDVWLSRFRAQPGAALPTVSGEYAFQLPTILTTGSCKGEWLPTAIGMEVEPQGSHTAVWSGQEMIIWGGGAGGGRYNPLSDTWTPTSGGGACPLSRSSHSVVWTGTEMIVWGGVLDGSYVNSGGRYSPATDTWVATSTGTDCPIPRYHHTAVWTGSEMIIWGGIGGSGSTALSTGGRYNPATNSWSATLWNSSTAKARSDHTAVWTGTEMVVLGGTGVVVYAAGGRYSPATNTWTALTGPKAIYRHTAVWTGSEIIVWGGLDASGAVSNLGWRYKPSGNTWTAISTASGCPTGRVGHVAFWTGTQMLVWGGSYSLTTGALYNPSSDSWAATSTSGTCPQLSSFSGVWTGEEMIVYGAPYNSTLGGARYNPTTAGWTPISQAKAAPYTSADPAAAWTGAEMFLWGGLDGAENRYPYFSAIYRPATGAWSRFTMPMGTSEFPGVAGETDLPAIWTGAEVIVWGGGITRSGLRYDPLRSVWRRTASDPGAPLSRTHHSLVWTGTEMIVWGGRDTHYAHFSNGGCYNPRTDSWRSVSMGPGCPSPRSRHTTVWTGSEMIVWGGQWQADSFDPVQYRGDGARYSPSTDTWTSLPSPGGLLTPRMRHGAVWTGDKMLLWGGWDGAASPTGATYHLGSNSWTAMSSGANSPSARQRFVCTWTGSEMLVWGGDSGSFPYYADGALYDPTTDAWHPMDTVHLAPVARTGAASVWTGSSLLMWGGKYLRNVLTYTGGEFRPGPVVSGPTHLCGLPSVTLSTGEFLSYQWFRDGQALTGATARTLPVSTGGDYSVRVQDSVGLSCTSPPMTVTAAPAPTIQVADAPCATASLSTQAFAAYQWYLDGEPLAGNTARACNASLPGSYTVAVTDEAGCAATSPPFTVHPSIKPAITMMGSCVTGWLDAGPGYEEYQWWYWSYEGEPICGATERYFRAETSGVYRVRVRSAECYAFSDWFHVSSPPQITITPPSPKNTCPSPSVRISTSAVGTAYQWAYSTWNSTIPYCAQNAGIPIPGATLPYFDAYDKGHYWVYVTDASGCTSVGKVSLQTTVCTGAEACPTGSRFPLRLEKSNVSPTGYYLILGPGNGASLNFYEGTLGQWYSHGNRTDWACYPPYESESLLDLTQRVPFVPSEGNRYYLLTSITNGTSGQVEGPSGYASSGAEIDPAQNTCAP